jgi:hypothetical protein
MRHQGNGRSESPGRRELHGLRSHCIGLLQGKPEELSTPHHVQDPGAFEVAGKILHAESMAADGARVQDVNRGDCPAADPTHESAADNFDFRQFGH